MSHKELQVWLTLLMVVGSPALVGWLIPTSWLFLSVIFLFGFLLMLAIPVFVYLVIAFGLNLIIARLRPAFRIAITGAVLVGVMLVPPYLLNLGINTQMSRLIATDRAVNLSTPPQSIAIYSRHADTFCDALCMQLLLNRQVDHVDVVNAESPVRAGMPAEQTTRRYRLETRADCPGSYAQANTPDNKRVSFKLTRVGYYFKVTGACLKQSTRQLTDNDIVIVKEARPTSAPDGDVTVDEVHLRTEEGFKKAGQKTYYSLQKILPVFIPVRPPQVSGTAGRLTLLDTWEVKDRPVNTVDWAEQDLGIRFSPANPMSIQPLRARVVDELKKEGPHITPDALETFRLFLRIVDGRDPNIYSESNRDPQDADLVKRINQKCPVVCRRNV